MPVQRPTAAVPVGTVTPGRAWTAERVEAMSLDDINKNWETISRQLAEEVK